MYDESHTNLKSIIDKSVNKAIEKVTASVNRIIEANLVVKAHDTIIADLKRESSVTQRDVNRLSNEQHELQAKLLSIENQTLENCLVIRGLPEDDYEKEGVTGKKVKDVLTNLISSDNDTEKEQAVKNIEIRRCRRLGKYKDRARPISVDFLHKDDTDFIMENKSHLTQGVYADREYNQETERKCKLLCPILKAVRQKEEYQGRCKME